jgi:serine/threonine protein kinase
VRSTVETADVFQGDEDDETGDKVARGTKAKTKQLGEEMSSNDEDTLNKSDRQQHTVLQCAGYGLESLSCGVIRCHSVGIVLDGPFLQLAYYDRSKVILSTPADLRTPENMDFFLASLHQLCTLSDEKRGILPTSSEDNSLPILRPRINTQYWNGEANTSGSVKGPSLVFPGSNAFNACEMEVDGMTLELGEMVYRAHGIIGRGTTVIKAKLEGKDVIVKLSFPGKSRTPEDELVEDARQTAMDSAEHQWALNHLPNIIKSKTYDLEDMPQSRLAKYFEEKGIPYEQRCLRITVQEALNPLTDLLHPSEYAQVFFDILQIHRWLVDHAKILHRDISLANIMFRRIDGKVYGVLNDFDLSSRLSSISEVTSLQRTGTKPYMAHELLDKNWDKGHLYRHDLESLFYVMVIFCSDYDKQESKLVKLKNSQYQRWFSSTNADVQLFKRAWLPHVEAEIQTTSVFSGFNVFYLSRLRKYVAAGHNAKHQFLTDWKDFEEERQMHEKLHKSFDKSFTKTFDYHTLGGHVTYAAFEGVMQSFSFPTTTNLDSEWTSVNLVIRYVNPLPLDYSLFPRANDSTTPTTAS